MVALISVALVGICFLMSWIHLVSAFGSKPQHGIPSRKITKALSSTVKNKFSGDDLISVDEIRDLRRTKIGSKLDGYPTLVLNADYTPLSHVPLSIWNWQDSLRAIFNGKAVVVAEYHDIVIRSVSTSINLPSVIALKTFHKKPNGVPPMTRRYVFIRDGFKCQYCGDRKVSSKLSLDHVIPRSKGGKLTWTNTVTACLECNYRKGSTGPEELSRLGMRLLKDPYAPTIAEIQFKGKNLKRGNYHPHWLDFL